MSLAKLLRTPLGRVPASAFRMPLFHIDSSGLHSASSIKMKASMDSIKELRKRTGAPIGAVKNALEEQSGDIEAAIDHLRKLGATMAAKKAHREASEGLVGIVISDDSSKAVILELNSETDFVARTPQFGSVVQSLTNSLICAPSASNDSLLKELDVEDVLNVDGNRSVLSGAVSSLGENIVLKRVSSMRVQRGQGSIFGYVHGSLGDGSGRIGVLVALEGTDVNEVGRRIAMHIAAASPGYVSSDAIPAKDIEKERSILMEAARTEQKPGSKPKPQAVLERMADGRMKKWMSSVVLEEQEMLVEGSSYAGKPRSVKASLASENEKAKVLGFARFEVGEKLPSA